MRTGLLMDLESVPTGNEILYRITLVSRQSRRTFDRLFVHSFVGNPDSLEGLTRSDRPQRTARNATTLLAGLAFASQPNHASETWPIATRALSLAKQVDIYLPAYGWTNRLDVALPARTFSGAKRVPRIVSFNQTVFLGNWALTGAVKPITYAKAFGDRDPKSGLSRRHREYVPPYRKSSFRRAHLIEAMNAFKRRFSQHPKLGLRNVARCGPLDLWAIHAGRDRTKDLFWQSARSKHLRIQSGGA